MTFSISHLWFYDRGKITQRDASGKPEFIAGIVFNISEKKEKEQNLIHKNELLEMQSMTDVLTGVRNRRAIMEELEMRVNQALVYNSPLSIVLLDIDHFNKINDDYGHQYGDVVLNIVATTISELTRDIDSVGRYGGEEFLLVLPNTDMSKAVIIAERIREAVEGMDLPQKNSVTISGGVAVLSGETSSELINKADMKLYEAKNDGRNRIKA